MVRSGGLSALIFFACLPVGRFLFFIKKKKKVEKRVKPVEKCVLPIILAKITLKKCSNVKTRQSYHHR